MLRTGAGHPSREHLASLGEIAFEDFDILIVYILYFFRTKSAELSSLESSLLQGNSFLLSDSLLDGLIKMVRDQLFLQGA